MGILGQFCDEEMERNVWHGELHTVNPEHSGMKIGNLSLGMTSII